MNSGAPRHCFVFIEYEFIASIEADSMKILDFLSQNEDISVVFMSNGVFAVHTKQDKVFIAPTVTGK